MVQSLAVKLGWSAFSLLFVAVGLFMAYRGWEHRARSDRIERVETTRIGDVRPGTVEITGTARPAEDAAPIETPITRADALAFHVEVEEWSNSSEGSGNWRSIYERREAVPLLVDDGSGSIRVDPPTDGGVNVERIRTTVDGGEEPSEPIRRFVEREAGVDEASRYDLGPVSVGERRRYSEGAIEPGEAVYVLGRAREARAGWDRPDYVIDEPTASGEFVLSDKSEGQLVEEGRVGGLLLLAAGGVFALVGALFGVAPWLLG